MNSEVIWSIEISGGMEENQEHAIPRFLRFLRDMFTIQHIQSPTAAMEHYLDILKMDIGKMNSDGGRYWDRTSGLFRVKEALSH